MVNNRPENMEEVLKKAEVLIEALPYIQKFNRKIIVVKYGGSAMSDEALQKNVIKDVTASTGSLLRGFPDHSV